MTGGGGPPPQKQDELQPHPVKDQLPNVSYCITSPPPWHPVYLMIQNTSAPTPPSLHFDYHLKPALGTLPTSEQYNDADFELDICKRVRQRNKPMSFGDVILRDGSGNDPCATADMVSRWSRSRSSIGEFHLRRRRRQHDGIKLTAEI